MSEDVELPRLIVKTSRSEFRLRCHAIAWSEQYGGRIKVRGHHGRECPGLLMLSATGPDTAVKSVRATLYQPEVEAEFVLESECIDRIIKAKVAFDNKPAAYSAAVAKLAPGVIHLVALARIAGLMPNMSDDHLWAELNGPRYTTPLLRSWIPWLKETMTQSGAIVLADGLAATVGVLKADPEALDDIVSQGIRDRVLTMRG